MATALIPYLFNETNRTIGHTAPPVEEETFTIYIMEILYVILTQYSCHLPVLFGIPGNLLVITIAFRKSNRHLSSCTYLAALGMADTVILIGVAWTRPVWFGQ